MAVDNVSGVQAVDDRVEACVLIQLMRSITAPVSV